MATTEQDRAIELSIHTNRATSTFRTIYGVTIDDKGRCGFVENDGTGILRPRDKVYIEHAFIREFGTSLVPGTVKAQLVPAWTAAAAKIRFDCIKPFVFKSAALKHGEYAWGRLTFDPAPVPCPEEFEAILSRTAQRDSLTLWIGSILDYEFPRIQYLHMYGPGGDGKSLIAQFLESTLGLHASITMYPNDLVETHGTTKLEGTRLVSFKDETNLKFVSSGAFKRITGDNVLTINPKGALHRNIVLNCKILIYSNTKPDLNGGHADLRRIIPVEFSKYNGGHDVAFEKRLLANGAQILQFCHNAFLEWKQQNPNKVLPTDANMVADLKEESIEGRIESLLDMDFEIDPKQINDEAWRIPATDITLWAQANIDGDYKKVRSVLTAIGLVSMPYKNQEGRSIRTWRGIRRRQKSTAEGFLLRPKMRLVP